MMGDALPASPPGKPAPHAPPADFDFEFGRWRVHNERLRTRLAGCTEWQHFEAVRECHPILGGMGNREEIVSDGFDNTRFIGTAIRLFDPARRLWSIHWADNRRVRFDPPMVGRFEHGLGTFYGIDEHQGGTVHVRFLWHADTRQPYWEQAFSIDEGQSWETNWVMRFSRIARLAEATS
jgi:hypothetical protein